MLAAEMGHEDVIKVLLSKGVDIQATSKVTRLIFHVIIMHKSDGSIWWKWIAIKFYLELLNLRDSVDYSSVVCQEMNNF